ncbi:MAG TPA: hypothetical protein VLX92_02425 [Kofleriaceae bacterium]|nr:hypothetical protein [Kofleriaceae bacterium]
MLKVALAALALAACQSYDVSRSLGARCDTGNDCDDKCLGPGSDWPGGFCTTDCSDDGSCASGARCIAEDDGVCAFGCSGDPDCTFLGSGYTCQLVDPKTGGLKVMICHGG